MISKQRTVYYRLSMKKIYTIVWPNTYNDLIYFYFRFASTFQIWILFSVFMIVGLLQSHLHGKKMLAKLIIVNLLLLNCWIYCWSINLAQTSLPFKILCFLFILHIGWNDESLWANTANAKLFIMSGKTTI